MPTATAVAIPTPHVKRSHSAKARVTHAPAKSSGEGSASHETAEHTAPAPNPTTPPRKKSESVEPSPSLGAEGSASREAVEHAGPVRNSELVFGLDLEKQGIVATGAILLVAAGVIALALRRRWVVLLVGAFALGVMAFDIREAIHQNIEGRPSLIAIASVLAATHLAAALLALIAFARNHSKAVPALRTWQRFNCSQWLASASADPIQQGFNEKSFAYPTIKTMAVVFRTL
ncbi:MAG: hypothetical protein ACYDCC_02765 [Actinomycetota bacterium]